MQKNEIFRKSVLVVAHPDDEALWFSSILDKVEEVIICFLGCESKSWLSNGRKESLKKHPIENLVCLDIEESEACSANWENPKLTEFGIAMTRKSHLLKRRYNQKYAENYRKLKTALERKLVGYQNIFTHNPWGEYGNEEHIQIYTVIKELQKAMIFELRHSNYCSNVSFKLMLKCISGSDSEYVTLETNKDLAGNIKAVYMSNGCWTWYDDWQWFNEECFRKDEIGKYSDDGAGHFFPLNLIKIRGSKKVSIFRKFI